MGAAGGCCKCERTGAMGRPDITEQEFSTTSFGEEGLDQFEFVDRSISETKIHMIICTLEYKSTNFALTSGIDGKNILQLAKSVGANVEQLIDNNATTPNLLALIKKVGSRCVPGDYFVFYYAGHGTQLASKDKDEEDGKDECLALMDGKGQTSAKYWLRDDDLALHISSSLAKGVKVLILTDCCHSGTIADLGKSCWSKKGLNAMAISGCKDDQTSGDIGFGGIMTHSLLLAVDRLTVRGGKPCSVTNVYQEITGIAKHLFPQVEQNITMHSTGQDTGKMLFPLLPQVGSNYVSPLRKKLGKRANF